MRAQFSGAAAFSRGRWIGLLLAIGAVAWFCGAGEEKPPPEAARPQRAAQFPPFRQVPAGSAVLRDPFAVPVSGAGALPPVSSAVLPAAAPSFAQTRALAQPAGERPRLAGIVRQGARVAAVFVWGKETKICGAGERVGPYRVDALDAEGALLRGPDGALRLRVAR